MKKALYLLPLLLLPVLLVAGVFPGDGVQTSRNSDAPLCVLPYAKSDSQQL